MSNKRFLKVVTDCAWFVSKGARMITDTAAEAIQRRKKKKSDGREQLIGDVMRADQKR